MANTTQITSKVVIDTHTTWDTITPAPQKLRAAYPFSSWAGLVLKGSVNALEDFADLSNSVSGGIPPQPLIVWVYSLTGRRLRISCDVSPRGDDPPTWYQVHKSSASDPGDYQVETLLKESVVTDFTTASSGWHRFGFWGDLSYASGGKVHACMFRFHSCVVEYLKPPD